MAPDLYRIWGAGATAGCVQPAGWPLAGGRLRQPMPTSPPRLDRDDSRARLPWGRPLWPASGHRDICAKPRAHPVPYEGVHGSPRRTRVCDQAWRRVACASRNRQAVCTPVPPPTTLRLPPKGGFTAPGTGDNRATNLPDGTALLFGRLALRQTTGSGRGGSRGGDPRRLYESAATLRGFAFAAEPGRGTRLSFRRARQRQGTSFMACTNAARGNDSRRFSGPWAWRFWGPEWLVVATGIISLFFRAQGGGAKPLNIWGTVSRGSEIGSKSSQPAPWFAGERPGQAVGWSPELHHKLAFSAANGTERFPKVGVFSAAAKTARTGSRHQNR